MSRRERLAKGLLLLALGAFAGAASGRQNPAPRHPAQRIPAAADFPTGPAIGERLPDFTLPNQRGEAVDFHADRGGHKAAVVFQRSAVW
jgi:hypothetical protein